MSSVPLPPGNPDGSRRDFLLPVLPVGSGPPDPVAIATWQMAASDALGSELPHDLLALWLFPESGGVVLLGPTALAEDQVAVPRPDPYLGQEQLLALEDRFRRAGYLSVIAAPIRDQHRDLGLLLLAALAAGRFGPIQAIRLFDLLRHFNPPFRRLADRMPAEPGATSLPRGRDPDSLLSTIVRTAAEARSSSDLMTRLSTALQDLFPHDWFEVVVRRPRGGAEEWEFLGREKPSRRWGKDASPTRPAGSASPRGIESLIERLAGHDSVVIADLAKDRQLVWPFREEGASAPNVHSMLAATLTERGSCAGFLLLGSVATDLYRHADEAMIRGVTPIVAIHAAAFQAQEEVGALRRTVTALEGPGGAIARAVRLLAATPALGVATQAIAAILTELTGCSSARFILRLGTSEVVTVEPGDTRPLLDLPLTPIEGAAFAPVLQGQSAFLLRPGEEDEQLILPLRVGAQPIGVMILTGPAGGRLAGIVFAAQQVADTVAPHLELVRREAGLEVRGASPGGLNPR